VNDNEIERIQLPDELVTITPVPDGLTFAYQRAPDGTDLIALIIDDKRVGPVRSQLTVDAAQVVSVTMAAMLNDLDNLRAQWKDTQR
jgi:hypothetical protein